GCCDPGDRPWLPTRRSSDLVEHEAVADRVAGPLRVTRERLGGGVEVERAHPEAERHRADRRAHGVERAIGEARRELAARLGMLRDRKSTRLNSSHVAISYAV